MHAKKILLTGRFATPDDVERQIAREQQASMPLDVEASRETNELLEKFVKSYLEHTPRAKTNVTKFKTAKKARSVPKASRQTKGKTNESIRAGLKPKSTPKFLIKKHKRAKFLVRKKDAQTVVPNKIKPYAG